MSPRSTFAWDYDTKVVVDCQSKSTRALALAIDHDLGIVVPCKSGPWAHSFFPVPSWLAAAIPPRFLVTLPAPLLPQAQERVAVPLLPPQQPEVSKRRRQAWAAEECNPWAAMRAISPRGDRPHRSPWVAFLRRPRLPSSLADFRLLWWQQRYRHPLLSLRKQRCRQRHQKPRWYRRRKP